MLNIHGRFSGHTLSPGVFFFLFQCIYMFKHASTKFSFQSTVPFFQFASEVVSYAVIHLRFQCHVLSRIFYNYSHDLNCI